MPVTEATIESPLSSRYLQQLCKHWSHKFAVTFTPEQGTIPFDDNRRCLLTATPAQLHIRIETPDALMQERMQTVVIDHLQRFATKEDFGTVEWKAAA
ncbi:MAG: DUF2218 domain-containing protein [Micavibrio sp.]|nr:DUF2218 domain-containing protein [Micavibrio sp.]